MNDDFSNMDEASLEEYLRKNNYTGLDKKTEQKNIAEVNVMAKIYSKIAAGQAPASPEDAYLMEQDRKTGIKPGIGTLGTSRTTDGFLNIVEEQYSARNVKWQPVTINEVFTLYNNDFTKTNKLCNALNILSEGKVVQLTVEGKEFFVKPNGPNSFLLASYRDSKPLQEIPQQDNLLDNNQLDEAFSNNTFKDEVKTLKNPKIKASVESLMNMSAKLRAPQEKPVQTLSENTITRKATLKEVNKLFMAVQSKLINGNKSLEELADTLSNTIAESLLEDTNTVSYSTMDNFVKLYNKKTGGDYSWR